MRSSKYTLGTDGTVPACARRLPPISRTYGGGMAPEAGRLREAIERTLVPPWGGTVERTIFGTDDVGEIIRRVDEACALVCGRHLADGFFYSASVGSVFGCVLDDGRRVVLKAYQPRWTPAFLAAVRRVQHHLHGAGFPCPEVIGDVTIVAGTTFVTEAELPDPGWDSGASARADTSAARLCELVRLCSTLDEPDLVRHPLRIPHDGPFPEPHSPIFDFPATAAGAEWLDGLAVDAHVIVAEDESPPVIVHTDWSMRNVRTRGDRVVAVYDWDSLALVKESEALGLAASTWSRFGEANDVSPSADDVDAYIDAYEAVRDEPLTAVQRRAARAAAVATMAYIGRCDHAIDPGEQTWQVTRTLLRSDAHLLLT